MTRGPQQFFGGVIAPAFTPLDEEPDDMDRTVVTTFSGTVVMEVVEFNPDAAAALADRVGVLRRGRRCSAGMWTEELGPTRLCCRTVHPDPWHIDGQWPTTPWKSDQFGTPPTEVSR